MSGWTESPPSIVQKMDKIMNETDRKAADLTPSIRAALEAMHVQLDRLGPIGKLLVIRALHDISMELVKAYEKHPGRFTSDHEGYAVILEEVDELREKIKGDSSDAAGEAMQVAAMAIRFLVDLYL